MPSTLTVREGKISRKLKTTSSTHANTAMELGRRMSPLDLSMAEERFSIMKNGADSEKMRK